MSHKCTRNFPPNGHHLHNFVIQHHTAHSQCVSKRCLGKSPFENFSHKSVVQRHVSLTPLCSFLDLHCPFLVVPPWSSLVILLCSLWPFLMVPSSWSLPGGGPFLVVVPSLWFLPHGSLSHSPLWSFHPLLFHLLLSLVSPGYFLFVVIILHMYIPYFN